MKTGSSVKKLSRLLLAKHKVLCGFLCRRLSTDVFIPHDFPHENDFETRKVTLLCAGSYPD